MILFIVKLRIANKKLTLQFNNIENDKYNIARRLGSRV